MRFYEFPFGIPADLYLNAFRKAKQAREMYQAEIYRLAPHKGPRISISQLAFYTFYRGFFYVFSKH